jgi:hypothetical protein
MKPTQAKCIAANVRCALALACHKASLNEQLLRGAAAMQALGQKSALPKVA